MEFISKLMEKIYIFAAQNAETSLLLHVRRKTLEKKCLKLWYAFGVLIDNIGIETAILSYALMTQKIFIYKMAEYLNFRHFNIL